jgi:glycosyltransferase involved in cell wall biosynthesis
MSAPLAVYITNVPVPYRYQLYKSFTNDEDFEGCVVFDSMSYGETWGSDMDAEVKYDLLGGKSVAMETGRAPVNFKLIRYLRKKRPDVIVLTEYSPLWVIQTFLYMMLSMKRIKLISMTDESRDFLDKLSFRWVRLLFRKWVLRYADKCICCSESSREHIEQISNRMKGKTVVSYLTPEASYYEMPTDPAQVSRPIQLLTVCRLVEVKRVDRLIQAIKLLNEKQGLADWQLTIIGDGPEKARLQTMAQAFGLNHRVNFLGRLVGTQVREAYRRADIFLLSSNKEPWGVVVHEAMLGGLAPVVTQAVGASEIVSRAGGIVIIDQLDEQSIVHQIASVLENLINNPDKVREIRQRCKQYASMITIESQVAAYLSAVK